jgi:type IV pilus assembly protein PilA
MGDVQSTQQEKLYRAAVGHEKAGYYVPRFLKFDQPGASRLSWHWPAFFVTFLWLLYRRMYGYALMYFLLLFVAGLLDVLTGVPASKVVSLGALIVIPMFANELYYGHVQRMIARKAKVVPAEQLVSELERGPHTTHLAWLAVPAAVVGIGVFASIATPAYQDYSVRTQVTEGLNLAGAIRTGVAESYARDGVWPETMADMGINQRVSGKYVAAVSVQNGTISVRYGGDAHDVLRGGVLTLRPLLSEEGDVVWDCGYAASPGIDPPTGPSDPGATTVPNKFLPTSCRTGLPRP